MTSHRRRHDGTRWPWLIALALTAVALSAVAAAWRLMPAPPAGWPPAGRPAPATAAGAGALMSALGLVNDSGRARGLLPPSACARDGLTMVTCMAPAPGITGVVFGTYPSLRALRAAYVARVRSLSSGQFAGNHPGCGPSEPALAGEAGWGRGRVFCAMTAGTHEDMVWTQDDGCLLGWVAGEPRKDVWTWWAAVHDGIVLRGSSRQGHS